MRRRHFEALQPVCPVCRTLHGVDAALRLAYVEREADEQVIEGVLHCTEASCQREYPILDGIPLLVANLRQYVSDNLMALYGRRDLSATAESLLGDCCGPNSVFDHLRQQLSSYVWDHYGEFDPQEPLGEPRPGSMVRVLGVGGELARPWPAGPILDAGCSVGRGALALAGQSDELVLGVDLHAAKLRLAGEVLRRGVVRYARRRVGIVYDRREFPVPLVKPEQVDFWACDAAALPFRTGTFALTAALNTLDSVAAPGDLLTSIARVLRPGGRAIVACPYDWSAAVTPLEAWVGGHSQRAPARGQSDAVLRELLTPSAQPAAFRGLELLADRDGLPWHVRLHDRATMAYRVHLVVAGRTADHVTDEKSPGSGVSS